MDVPGLSIRDGVLNVRANFDKETLEGDVSYRVSFPIGFRVNYEDAYNLLSRKEQDALRKLGIPEEDIRRFTACSRDDSIEQFNSILLNSSAASAPDPDFCASFDVPDRVMKIKSVRVNECLAPFTLVPYLDDSMTPRRGAVPFLPGDRHTLLEYDCDIVPRLDQQRTCSLLVSIPMVVLRLSLLKMRRAEDSFSSVGVISFPLKIVIEFELKEPHISNSAIYFGEYVYQPDLHQSSILKSVPLLLTAKRSPTWVDQKPWFPTAPIHRTTIPWTMNFTIPKHLSNLANGRMVKEVTNGGWKTTTYQALCLSSQIIWIAGALNAVDASDEAVLGPYTATALASASTTSTGAMPDDITEPYQDSEQEFETAEPPGVVYHILPGFEKRLKVSVCLMARVVGLLTSWLQPETRRKSHLVFLPPAYFGESEISLNGNLPRHAISTKNLEALYNDRRLLSFRGIAVDNICLVPFDELHGHDLLGERARMKKLNIAEALLHTWIWPGLAFSVSHKPRRQSAQVKKQFESDAGSTHDDHGEGLKQSPSGDGEQANPTPGESVKWNLQKTYNQLWLIVSMRKYFRHLLAAELFGRIEATVILQKYLDTYLLMTERGYERYPLAISKAGSINYSLLYPLSTLYQIKCYLILPALECLVMSLSASRLFLPNGFFRNFVFSYVRRTGHKEGSPHLDKFFDRCRHKVLQEFIRKKLHKTTQVNASSTSTGPPPPPGLLPPGSETGQVNVRDLPDSMSPEDLDVSLYRGHPTLDIEELVQDIRNFEKAYVYGIGCGLVTISSWFELQRKTGQLEVLKLRADQHALSSPELLEDMFSYYHPAVGAAPAIVNALLSSPQWLHLSTLQCPEDPTCNARNAVRQSLLQSSSVTQFLDQLSFDVNALRGNPLELVVKDNKLCFGYGYIGSSSSPLCGGRGTLFNSLVKQATGSWANLTPEERSAMASDSSSMELLVASTPTAMRVPVAALGGAQEWVSDILIWNAIKQAVSLHECIPKQSRKRGLPLTSEEHMLVTSWLDSLRKDAHYLFPHLPLWKGEIIREPFLNKLPESATSGCAWPTKLIMRVFEESFVTEDLISIKGTTSFHTMRDQSVIKKISMTPPRVLGVALPSQAAFVNGETCKLQGGVHGYEDVVLLNSSCNDNIRTQFAGSTSKPINDPISNAAHANPNNGGEGTAPQTNQSTRGAGTNLTPVFWMRCTEDSFIIGRVERFQGLSCWLNQLRKDTCIRSQLEAARALSTLATESSSAFDGLVCAVFNIKLHPYVRRSCMHGILHASNGQVVNYERVEKVLVDRLLPLYQESMCPGLINVNPMPPIYSNLGYEQLIDLYETISRLRNHVNETPDSVWSFFIQCLSRWPFPVDLRLSTSTSNFDETLPLHLLIARLVQVLPNLRFPQPFGEDIASWCDERTEQIFLAVYTRAEMEKKLPTSDRVVTVAYLSVIARVPAFQVLTRFKHMEKNLNYDPLFCYTPVARPVPDEVKEYLPLPNISLHRNSWKYLKAYRDKALHYQPITPQGMAIQCVSDQICDTLNYSDFTIQAKAMHTTLLLILKGMLIPPLWVLNPNPTTPLLVNAPAPYWCTWVDNVALQQTLQRTGLSVLYCVKLLAFLDVLLPFSNDAGLIVASWAAFLEVLESASEEAPLALLPFVLATSHTPVATSLKQQKKKSAKPHHDMKRQDNPDTAVPAALAPNGQSVPSQDLNLPSEDHLMEEEEEEEMLLEPQPVDKLTPASPEKSIDDILMEELGEDAMFETAENWEFDTIGEHFSALPDDNLSLPGHSDSEKMMDAGGYSRKPKKKRTKHQALSTDSPPLLVPSTIMVYELLFRYLHCNAPCLVAVADRLVYYIREVIYFLFGMGVPAPIRSCTDHLGMLMNALSGVPHTQPELIRIQEYIIANYHTLAPASTGNAQTCGRQFGRLMQQGVPVRAMSSYDRLEITCWSFSKVQDHWPLPLKIRWQTIAKRLIACLMEHPSGHWFIHPVNAKANPSYYKIIDSPIWLLKISEKLSNNEYSSFVELRNDIFTIFRNCRIFNAPMTLILLDCDILQSLSYQLLHFANRLLNNTDQTN